MKCDKSCRKLRICCSMKELNAGFESSSSIIVAFKVLAKFFTLALSSSHMQGSLSQGVKKFSEFDSSSEF